MVSWPLQVSREDIWTLRRRQQRDSARHANEQMREQFIANSQAQISKCINLHVAIGSFLFWDNVVDFSCM